ncbi:methyl-accepting chemotaxis protein [Sporolactobacillus sp. Y61]|uniref:Methyl-accepting chemotaxis protein n=1 Tax=Sporolactobacillus sp. Y61 TaxID=3160863 RepID=A0AAU8IJZ2_9BACL
MKQVKQSMGKDRKDATREGDSKPAAGAHPSSDKRSGRFAVIKNRMTRGLKKKLPLRSLQSRSIRGQLLVPMITLVVIIGLAGGIVSYFIGARMTTQALIRSTAAQLQSTNTNFETYFADAQSVVRQFAINKMLNDVSQNEEQIHDAFQNVLSSNDKYQALTFGSANKEVIRSPLYFFPEGYDPTKEAWYQSGIRGEGKSVWTNPYEDTVTKQNVVSVSQAVMNHGEVRGVVKLDLFILSIVNQVKHARFGQTGYAVLLDRSGKYIASPGKERTGSGRLDQSVFDQMKKMGTSGQFYTKIGGQQKLLCFQTNKTTGWTLAGVIDKSEISNQANVIALPSAITVILIILAVVLISSVLVRQVTGRLGHLQEAAKRIEEGDLTVSLPVKGSDEIEKLTGSINKMAAVNREVFRKLSEVARELSGAAQTLVASVEENTASSNEISATVTQIATGATSQASALDHSQSSLDSLVKQVKRMDQESREVLHGANEMDATSKGGSRQMKHLSKQSDASTRTTGQIIAAVTDLQKHAKEISKIIDVLDSIARRTNLLSLNASIEAAHAGENGRGFAVVASEIRKLAGQTGQSLKEVTATVRMMTEGMAQAVSLCEETSGLIRDQGTAVSDTSHAFDQIEATVAKNVSGIRRITDAIRKTQDNIEEISQGTQTIASTSEETAASTEEVSASVEQQTASMEELSKLATGLGQQAQRMEDAIRHFKI